MVPCSPNIIDIGPGLITVSLQVLSLLALVYGLNRNHQAITTNGNGGSYKNGSTPAPTSPGTPRL